MEPTKEQNVIFNEIENGNSHILIKALAGTGKSTTLIEAIKHIEIALWTNSLGF